MSHQATTWVMEFSQSRLADRLVLGAIAHRISNDDGEAFPSIKKIGREANICERQVYDSITSLVEMGELEVREDRSKYNTNVYFMPRFHVWMQGLHPAQSAPTPPAIHSKRVHSIPKNPAQNADELSVELSLEPSSKQPSEVCDVETEIQTPQRTRTCFKCGEDIPEDDALSHGKACQGRKKKSKRGVKAYANAERALKLQSSRMPGSPSTTQESIQDENFPPNLRRGFVQVAAPGIQENYAIAYGLMRRGYKMQIGKTLGSWPGGKYGEDLLGLFQENGIEKVEQGFDLWCESVDRDWIRKSSFPMAAFLKDAQQWIDDAAIKPEETEAKKSRYPEITKPAWED